MNATPDECKEDALTTLLKDYVEETHRRCKDDAEIKEMLETLIDEDPRITEDPLAGAVYVYILDMFFYTHPIDHSCLEPDTADDDPMLF